MIVDTTSGAAVSSDNIPVSGNTIVVPPIRVCNVQPSVFTFLLSQSQCYGSFAGSYYAGVLLNASNKLLTEVNVSVPGSYNIITNTADGISFSASGVFTVTGQQAVYLIGTGTPATTGSFIFSTSAAGISGCDISLVVVNVPPAQAVFDLGGPGAGTNTVISGSYLVGFPLTSANTVTLTANVAAPGIYSINTNVYLNGMFFKDSGMFVNTGNQSVVLKGFGTPQNAWTQPFSVVASNGTQGCNFSVASNNTSDVANYTFEGAPGLCPSPIITGTFFTDTTLTSQRVGLTVNVTSPGSYSIITNQGNGFSFTGSGIFPVIGLTTVFLNAVGTPVAPGTNNFIPQAQGITTSGCEFAINTN